MSSSLPFCLLVENLCSPSPQEIRGLRLCLPLSYSTTASASYHLRPHSALLSAYRPHRQQFSCCSIDLFFSHTALPLPDLILGLDDLSGEHRNQSPPSRILHIDQSDGNLPLWAPFFVLLRSFQYIYCVLKSPIWEPL